MKKITTLFAVVALATTMGLAGCKKDKKTDEATPPKTEEAVKPDPAKPDPAAGTTTTTTTTTTTAASTGMPECDDYLKAVEKYAACDKLPAAAKDPMMKGVETMKATWTANMPDEAKKAAGDGCKAALDGMKTAASAMGCAL